MPENIYLQNYNIPEDGVLVEYRTTGEYTPAHWHDSLELVYILNGNATIYLEGSEHKLVPGEFIVIDTNQIHEARCTRTYMMIVVRIDDDLIQRLMGNKRNFQIICSRAELTDELVPAYLEICDCLKKLVQLHVRQPKGYMIATQSIALDILYRLITDFSIPLYKATSTIWSRCPSNRSQMSSASTATISAACSGRTSVFPSRSMSTTCGSPISTTISARQTSLSWRCSTSTDLLITNCSAACSRKFTGIRPVRSGEGPGRKNNRIEKPLR